MGKKNKKESADERFLLLERRVLIAIGIAIALFGALFYADKYIFGYVHYYSTWTQCGQQPVIVNGFWGADEYIKPGEQGYHISPINNYICSEQEAVQKGYKHQTQNM